MHKTQERLLALADTEDLGNFSYYALAKKFDIKHHNKIKFHINQLVKKGLLLRNERTGSIRATKLDGSPVLLNIPIYGQANCGEALQVADNRIEAYLKLSPSLIQTTDFASIFALRAVGNSMDKANINGLPISDGDYVLVKSADKVEIISGDYVVSIIDGLANVKRFYKDYQNKRFVLSSESSEILDPILIAEEDLYLYSPVGKVIEVIKGTQHINNSDSNDNTI